MSMSKKDFEKITEVLGEHRDGLVYYKKFDFNQLLYDMCEVLKDINPQFNTDKFMRYIERE